MEHTDNRDTGHCAEQLYGNDGKKTAAPISAAEGLHRAAESRDMVLNSQVRDSSSKIIFDDHILCSQFLRDYVDLPYMKDVKPEDIEDVSEQYVTLFAEERNSDRVKRVHIDGAEEPFFLVSLIEHKTKPDYNVCMQIFRYMVYIWDTYEKEAESIQRGMAKRSDFLYPPILPIVYYEGSREWKVPLDFRSRIRKGDRFGKYLPDFSYYLVPLRKYSNETLMANKDEISLVMLVNKLQTLEDIEDFRRLPGGEIEEILQHSPRQLVDTIADVLQAFLLKMNMSVPETEQLTDKVRKKKMGELFADMDKIDIQAERRKVALERECLKEEQRRVEEEQRRVEEEQRRVEEEQKQVKEEQRRVREEQRRVEEEQKQVKEEQRRVEEEQRRVEEEQRRVKEEQRRVEEERKRIAERRQIEEAQEQADDMTDEDRFRSFIEVCQELGASEDTVVQKLMTKMNLSREAALEKTGIYWKK